MGPAFSGIQDLLPQTIDERTALSYIERIPPSLVHETTLAGTPTEILDQLSEWRDHGLRFAVILNLGAVHPKLHVGLGASLPLLQLLRGMRRL